MMSSSAAPKVTKKVAAKAATVEAPVPALVPVAPAEPVKKAAVKKASVAKAEAPVVAAPVVVAPVSAPVAEAPAAAAPVTTLEEDIKSVTGNLATMRETVVTLLGQIKRLEKRVHREIKDARKRKRRVKTDENGVEVKRAPSIFERPTQISEELCHFLGKSKGSLMSRSEVTKAVNNYVKEKNLKNKHDIKPDASLKKLLGVPEGEQLTYFNLQRYLNKHYIKTVPAATA
jgi:upstream activation factor subunit UAF30